MRILPLLALVAVLAAPLAAAQSTAADSPALTVSPGESAILLAPAEERVVKAQITNPTDLTLDVQVTATSPARTDGTRFLVNPASSAIRIPPRASEIVHFTVTAPPREAAPYGADIVIRAESTQVDPGEGRIAARLAILDLVLEPRAVPDPGTGESRFKLIVRNPGPHVIETAIVARSPGHLLETGDPSRMSLEPRSERILRYTLRKAEVGIPEEMNRERSRFVTFAASTLDGQGSYGKAVLAIRNATDEPPPDPTVDPAPPMHEEPPVSEPTVDAEIRLEAIGRYPKEVPIGRNDTILVRVVATRGDPGEVRVQAAIKAMPDVAFAVTPEIFVLTEGESREVEIGWSVPVTTEPMGVVLVDAGLVKPSAAHDQLHLSVIFSPPLHGDPIPPVDDPLEAFRGDPAGFIASHPLETAGAAGGASLAAVGLALLARRESLRFALLAPAVGLFTRLSRPKVLDHALRDTLLGAIRAKPGVTYGELKRAFDLNTGTLIHHLQMLEQHRFVASRREGRARRFYPVGERLPEARADEVTPMQTRILALLDAGPLTQKQLAERLGLTKQGANHHIKTLERKGRIAFELRNGVWVCVRAAPEPVAFVPVEREG
ncbi:MAG TPA: MarR family transcriptional regulator [Candidatus Thermoplasmatota archaeon]|nr:MarR family transcriptional regulator [Candidatus Thermoplasmatota archaeon]